MASNTGTRTKTEANATSDAPTSEPSEAAEETAPNGDGHDEGVHGTTTTTAQPKPTKPPPTKGGGKTKGKQTADIKCANCGSPASQRCKGCGMVHYCRKNVFVKDGKQINACQKVPVAPATCTPAGTTTTTIIVHTHAHRGSPPRFSHTLPPPPLPLPGALAARRPQEGLQGLRARRHRPRAAGTGLQGGGRDGQVPGVPGPATRADAAAVRPLVLHGVRGGAAVEGRVGDVPSVPRAAAAGSGRF